jgi:CDP-glucose 4,6-dehydratase
MLNNLFSIYKGKKVLITGNTGFKGTWLSSILLQLHANVVGYALAPEGSPNIYDKLNLSNSIKQYIHDIRSIKDIKKCLIQERPDIVFHLAAQPLVRESYMSPLETMDVNIMGTIKLLEAIRQVGLNIVVIVITTDKCYQNNEWLFGYREVDAIGGYDPYSASKGAVEVVTKSYRSSFFNPADFQNHGVKIASARAGNVIGGGDWAKDRIVPDAIKALSTNERVFVRNPYATRPWQHVLEPLSGYLSLGAKLLNRNSDEELESAFNFGPLITSNKNVKELVQEIIVCWGEGQWYTEEIKAVHEASLLNLTIDKAYHLLNWCPKWDFNETVKHTVDWYKAFYSQSEAINSITNNQIVDYFKTNS